MSKKPESDSRISFSEQLHLGLDVSQAVLRLLSEKLPVPEKTKAFIERRPDLARVIQEHWPAVETLYNRIKENRISVEGDEYFPMLVEHLRGGGHVFLLGPHWSVVDIMAFQVAYDHLEAAALDKFLINECDASYLELLNDLAVLVPTSSKFFDGRMGAVGGLMDLLKVQNFQVVQPGDDAYTSDEAIEINKTAYRQILKAMKAKTSQVVGFFPQSTRNKEQATTLPALQETMSIIRPSMRAKTLVVPFAVIGAHELSGKSRALQPWKKLQIIYSEPISYAEIENLAKELGDMETSEIPLIIALSKMDRKYWGIYTEAIEKYLTRP